MKKEEFWAKQYRRHIAKMVGVCYRYVADWQVAEDLAQDAFLTAMEKSGTLRFWESIESWLTRIAVNQALMYLRNRPEMVALEEEPMDAVEDQPDEVAENKVEFTQEELLELIGKLPTKQRTVFNLYAVEHCPHAKIAETLGITVANSKVLLTRARAELQQRLKVIAMKR
ncbi:MAG: sigma-70 family RNA polymerase sigma factor [Bacteroidales bacterium]|nr:sigma-70 family RNA polymerase sigma factor [Bacteroidales bacterium]